MDEEVSLSTRTGMEDVNLGNLKNLLVPLIEKVDQLRESVDTKYGKLESAILTQRRKISEELQKIENSITTQQSEIKNSLTLWINENSHKVQK